MDTKQINAIRIPALIVSCTILIVWSCLMIGIQLFHHTSIFNNQNFIVSALSLQQQSSSSSSYSNTNRRQLPKGSAATPFKKQKVLIAGTGGYMGAMTFGYIQRAASLYGTGIAPTSIRCIGATSDTSIRLNRILNKHFVLAQADESYIKLTNLLSVDAITQRMIGYDTIILGANMFVQQKIVTANTYETSPNDKAWEIYWDEPKGSFTNYDLSIEAIQVRDQIMENLITAAQQAQLKHLFLVVDTSKNNANSVLSLVQKSGIPFTCLHTSQLTDNASNGYTFQDGIINDLILTAFDDESDIGGSIDDTATTETSSVPVCREDLAAICVQAIQSLDWNRPQRHIKVVSSGRRLNEVLSSSTTSTTNEPKKRMDQEWCINSFVLEEKLNSID